MPDDPDDLARLFYLTLLLLVLAAGTLFGRGRSLGKTLQQALIWTLIFAMAVIAYGFRDTLRSAVFPGAALQVQGDAIELRRAADGHFHATLDVNGIPVRFLVDTGASDIVLSAWDAERIGLDRAGLVYGGTAATANGTVRTAAVRLDRVEFGELIDRNLPAQVTSGALDVSLLGLEYLDLFASIEIRGDRMLLRR